EPIVDMSRLRKASWNGVPLRVRATVWQLLLGYLPSNQERRESTLERKRLEYAKYRDRYFSETAVAERDDEERELLHQISIDVLRTHPNTLLFRDQRIQDAMTRALYIWAIRHPASGYVQGINELITPFIVVFLYDEVMRQSSDGPSADSLDRRLTAETTDVQEWLVRTTSFDRSLAGLDVIEADAFGCLTKLLSNVQTHYTFAQPGIQRMLFKLEAVMKRIDPSLCGHLEKQQASFLVLSFRWMNCYLMREIPLHHIIRMWDTYMCEDEGFSTFHVYVCGAFLAMWSQKLMQCDFQGIMLFVQSLPTDAWTREDVEVLLSKAFMHKAQHEPHLSHLK
ncbi:MAG: TBC domain-containing protein, partial [archaeon]|nr:TBC domain-containing protein [archaeon]